MTLVRSRRIASIAALAAGAMILLSGCLDVKGNVTVNPDATASGDLSLALDKQAASFLEIGSLADFEKAFSSGELTDGDELVKGSACTSSETDDSYVYTCTFTDEAFAETGGLWTIETLPDGLLSFHLVNESSGMDDQGMLPEGTSMGSLAVNVTFPGPIEEIVGSGAEKTSDTTATITGELTTPIDVTITSAAGSSSNFLFVFLALLVALAILVLIIVVVIVLIMRRRRPEAIEQESAFAAPAPGVEDAVAAEDAAEKEDPGQQRT